MTNFAHGDRWQRIGTERAVRSVWTVTWEAGEDWGQVHSNYFVLLCLFVCFCLCIFRLCFVGDKLRGQRRKQWERERETDHCRDWTEFILTYSLCLYPLAPSPTVFSFDHRLAFARLCLLLRGPQTKNTDKSINFKNYKKCINWWPIPLR